MSNLKVNEIEGLTNDAVTCPHGLTATETITATGGITLGDDLACGSNDITGAGNITAGTQVQGATVKATGTVEAVTADISGNISADGLCELARLEVGSPSVEPASGECAIQKTLTVNTDSAATAVTVTGGKVDAGSSEVVVDTLRVGGTGGTEYTASDFSNFGGTTASSAIKASIVGELDVTTATDGLGNVTRTMANLTTIDSNNGSMAEVSDEIVVTLSPAMSDTGYHVHVSGVNVNVSKDSTSQFTLSLRGECHLGNSLSETTTDMHIGILVLDF